MLIKLRDCRAIARNDNGEVLDECYLAKVISLKFQPPLSA
jgi:hypothetical protein